MIDGVYWGSVVGDCLVEQEGVFPVHSARDVAVGLPRSEDVAAVDEGAQQQRARSFGEGSRRDFVLDCRPADDPECGGEAAEDAEPESFLFCLSEVLEGDAEGGHVVGVVLKVAHCYLYYELMK